MAIFRRHVDHDTVIDLTQTGTGADAQDSKAPQFMWGMPLPCPRCESPGYLDRIDPVGEVMYQHCPSCLTRWETDRADLEAIVNSS